jgi:hypothetical protein
MLDRLVYRATFLPKRFKQKLDILFNSEWFKSEIKEKCDETKNELETVLGTEYLSR